MVLGVEGVPSGEYPQEFLGQERLVVPSSSNPQAWNPLFLQNRSDDNLEKPNLPRLTTRNLSFIDDDQPTANSTSSTMSSRTASKTISYTDPEFVVELERRNVFEASKAFPTDWDLTKQKIERTRTDKQDLQAAAPSRFLPRGTTATLDHARMVALNAPNESIVTTEVVPSLVPVGSLLLSKEYDAITDSQWSSPPLPAVGGSDNRLCMPKPDLTIGYKQSDLENFLAIDSMKPFSTPVICRPELAFPCFCLEAKGLASTHFSTLQNRNNAAHMLRSLRTLRARANQSGWKEDFEKNISVVTASVSKEKIAITAHWVTSGQYYSRVVKSWVTEFEDWSEIHHAINSAIFGVLEKNRPWIIEDLKIVQEMEEDEHAQPPNKKRKS